MRHCVYCIPLLPFAPGAEDWNHQIACALTQPILLVCQAFLCLQLGAMMLQVLIRTAKVEVPAKDDFNR